MVPMPGSRSTPDTEIALFDREGRLEDRTYAARALRAAIAYRTEYPGMPIEAAVYRNSQNEDKVKVDGLIVTQDIAVLIYHGHTFYCYHVRPALHGWCALVLDNYDDDELPGVRLPDEIGPKTTGPKTTIPTCVNNALSFLRTEDTISRATLDTSGARDSIITGMMVLLALDERLEVTTAWSGFSHVPNPIELARNLD